MDLWDHHYEIVADRYSRLSSMRPSLNEISKMHESAGAYDQVLVFVDFDGDKPLTVQAHHKCKPYASTLKVSMAIDNCDPDKWCVGCGGGGCEDVIQKGERRTPEEIYRILLEKLSECHSECWKRKRSKTQ